MRNSKSLREYLEAETGLKAINPDGIPCLENLAQEDTLEYFDLTTAHNHMDLPLGSKLLDIIHNYYSSNPFSERTILGILDEEGKNTQKIIGEGKFAEYTHVTVFEDKIRVSRNSIKNYADESPREWSFAT